MPDDAIRPVAAPFPFPQLRRPLIPDHRYDIRDFGAGKEAGGSSTAAIRKAIETAARAGGGAVIVPAGSWRTGAIRLRSNINLHLVRGAELRFSQDVADYLPAVFSRHEDIECFKPSAFIYADGDSNIAITGTGTLNGQGSPWWRLKTERADAESLLSAMAAKGIPVEQRVFDGRNGRILRPAFVQPMRCRNVLVEGPTFLYGAFWTITPTYCENVIIRDVNIVTEGDAGHVPNGDGVDPSSCRNVLIDQCTFDTGDDCIAIKSGRDADGLRVAIPSENIVIRKCSGRRGHGGIVIGSETAGGIRNLFATECRFEGTDRMIRIKTARGRGGVIENLWFRNIEGRKIAQQAIHLNMLYTGERLPAQPVSATTPRIRNVRFDSVSCVSGKGYGVEILGLPEMPVEDVTFSRMVLRETKGVHIADARRIRIEASHITPGPPSTDWLVLDAGVGPGDVTVAEAPEGRIIAFPGAEGFGRFATGGRGGRICEVTTLNDSGPGSFREALAAHGPRTVVFRVAGTIQLRSPIVITEGNLTVAGQTAPGGGICIRDYDVRVEASNVIIRYMRFRRGDASRIAEDAFSGNGRQGSIPGPMIIDHCSISWGIDECSSFYDVHDFTMQWCFVTESLNHSYHKKGDHGYGGIWGGWRASFHHNLLAHHASRSPRFNGGRTSGQPDSELVDFRNNVLYNWGFNSSYGGERGRQNVVANYYRPGPATRPGVRARILDPWDSLGRWYVAENIVDGSADVTADNWDGGVQGSFAAVQKRLRNTHPFPFAPVETQPAPAALAAVLAYGGATLPARDAVDARIVREVREGSATYGGAWGKGSGIIDSQDQTEGWPVLAADGRTNPGTVPWSTRIGESFLVRHPDGMTYDLGSPSQNWNYEQGLMLVALTELGRHTGDPAYAAFVRKNIDAYVSPQGAIRTYRFDDFNLDNIAPGRVLLDLYQESKAPQYLAAADSLRKQLRFQPRTREGGFWHKKIYPYQMWLDGLFMAEPFYARYAALNGDSALFDDIANQCVWAARHTRDPRTGLLSHAWDESRSQKWADSLTGRSPNFWARAMGWYGMALVDVLDAFPPRHPRRKELEGLLTDFAAAVLRARDQDSKVWYQVIDQGDRPGNYLEASASCMFTYVFARGARTGLLEDRYLTRARESFEGVLRQFVTTDEYGLVDLHQTCRSAGLGGDPYRDGSFAYYISEPKRTNDMKGLGPLLRAAIELER
jgi:rhamnogalacturonyl hydrolase YesR/pectate lyase